MAGIISIVCLSRFLSLTFEMKKKICSNRLEILLELKRLLFLRNLISFCRHKGVTFCFLLFFFSIKINSQFYITFTFISTNLSTLNVFKEIWNFLPCMKHWCLQRSNPLSLNRNQAHWNLIYRITGFQIARTQLLIICRRLFFRQKKNDEIIFSDSFWMFWAQQIKSYGWIQEI